MTKLGVVFGGPSPEHDISILTGLQAARAMTSAGADVVCLYWTKTGEWLRVPVESEATTFLSPELKGASPVELAVPGGFKERRRLRSSALDVDVILNCCHGGPGEDGVLTGLLLIAGLRVTGPTPQACALAMDKLATGALAESVGLETIDTVLLTLGCEPADLPSFPWVAKPRFGGSSLGVEADVSDVETVQALATSGVGRAGMIVQPYLQGWTDLNVAVRTYPDAQCSAIERPLREQSVYTYKEKYLTGGAGMDAAPRELPAQIPSVLAERVRSNALAIVAQMGIHGAPRVDFLWDGGERLVLCEVNSIPGAWGNHLWSATGVSREALYQGLIDEALARRPGLPQWVGSSDGSALRASGSISSKLS
ncbi:MAG: hypothetical protein ACFCVK_15475 [Acidimicrobiales bacterium]